MDEIESHQNLPLIANYYHNLGFNIFPLIKSDVRNDLGLLPLLPDGFWYHLIYHKQSTWEMNSYNWEKANGIGFVGGVCQYRAVSIEGEIDKINLEFIKSALIHLGLGLDYPWLMRTGKGFQIIFKSEVEKFSYEDRNIFAFNWLDSNLYMCKVKIFWNDLVFLPPTMSDENEYKFINHGFPNTSPECITITNFQKFISSNFYNNFGFQQKDMFQIGIKFWPDYSLNKHEVFNPNEHSIFNYERPFFLLIDSISNEVEEDEDIHSDFSFFDTINLNWILKDANDFEITSGKTDIPYLIANHMPTNNQFKDIFSEKVKSLLDVLRVSDYVIDGSFIRSLILQYINRSKVDISFLMDFPSNEEVTKSRFIYLLDLIPKSKCSSTLEFIPEDQIYEFDENINSPKDLEELFGKLYFNDINARRNLPISNLELMAKCFYKILELKIHLPFTVRDKY
jgi:hypothetical protein